MLKPLGERMSRSSADTMPEVTVPRSPNGLPIATAGSPTRTSLESASDSGSKSASPGSMRSSARSVEGSLPTSRASTGSPPSPKRTRNSLRPVDDVVVGEDRAVARPRRSRSPSRRCRRRAPRRTRRPSWRARRCRRRRHALPEERLTGAVAGVAVRRARVRPTRTCRPPPAPPRRGTLRSAPVNPPRAATLMLDPFAGGIDDQ